MSLIDKEQFAAGTLAVVATPIGNLSDLSERAAYYLREADVVLCEDTRHSRKLLDSCDARAATTSYGSHNVRAKVPWILEQLQAGKKVGLICDAGTPGISDPGSLLIRSVIQEEIRVTMIPGPAALIPALVLSGLRTDRFVYEGFLPHKKGRKTRLTEIAKEPRTVVMYESVHRIRKALAELYEHCGDRKATVCRELTKLHEEVARGRLSELITHFEKQEPRGEFVIVLAGTEERTEQDSDDSHSELWEFFEAEIFPVGGGNRLFNPYCDSDPVIEIINGPELRRGNLQNYFEIFETAPHILILGEAYGPWGGRFSGIPFTGEAPLSNGELPFHGVTTSRSNKPYRERTGDIFWGELDSHAKDFFVWNTLPFHPYHEGRPLSIRSPSRSEITASRYWLQGILEILEPERVLAIGRVAESALREIGMSATYIRHPSRGGIPRFRHGMSSIFAETTI